MGSPQIINENPSVLHVLAQSVATTEVAAAAAATEAAGGGRWRRAWRAGGVGRAGSRLGWASGWTEKVFRGVPRTQNPYTATED